eukprot:12904303-Prorocentrum_lima.AAC.1
MVSFEWIPELIDILEDDLPNHSARSQHLLIDSVLSFCWHGHWWRRRLVTVNWPSGGTTDG